MSKNHSPKYTEIVCKYLDKYGEDMSNRKLAKKILRENEEIKLTPHSMRLVIGSVKEKWNAGIYDAFKKTGVKVNDGRNVWIKTKGAEGNDVSVLASNPLFQKTDYEDFKADIIDSIIGHEPNYPKIIRKPDKDGHLLMIDPADIHIGKLAESFETGEDYDSNIAVQRVKEGVQGILDKAVGFSIDQIVFIGGNDILHIDSPRRTTTAGTAQDTCGMWYSNFLKAKQLYIEILEMLISFADVHFVYNPSNHDYTHGFFLADCIQTHFRTCDNITFDCSLKHRKGYMYHKNLIGTTHGDGAKQADLPLLMAQEFPREWADTEHRYVYVHHFHHKTAKDYIGVTVESLRSASGTDSWHHRNGYQHAPKAIEGFLHHKKHGQIARFTHIF